MTLVVENVDCGTLKMVVVSNYSFFGKLCCLFKKVKSPLSCSIVGQGSYCIERCFHRFSCNKSHHSECHRCPQLLKEFCLFLNQACTH